MSKQTDVKVPPTDGQFSWQQFWQYFKSDICDSEMRKFTLRHLNLVNSIRGAMSSVQVEILEYAPREIITHPLIVAVMEEDAKRILMVANNSPPRMPSEEDIEKYLKNRKPP